MRSPFARARRASALLILLAAPAFAQPPAVDDSRPFGTLREQAEIQQAWLKKRLDTFLPALMRKHGIDMWVVPMREYNEDPVFSSLVAPETFAARRRTIGDGSVQADSRSLVVRSPARRNASSAVARTSASSSSSDARTVLASPS